MRTRPVLALLCLLPLLLLAAGQPNATGAIDTDIGIIGTEYTHDVSAGDLDKKYPVMIGDLVEVKFNAKGTVAGTSLIVDLGIAYAYEVVPMAVADGTCEWDVMELNTGALTCWYISADAGLWQVKVSVSGAASGTIGVTVLTSDSAYTPGTAVGDLERNVAELDARVGYLENELEYYSGEIDPLLMELGDFNKSEIYQRITQLEVAKDEALLQVDEVKQDYEDEKADVRRDVDATVYLAQFVAILLVVFVSILIGAVMGTNWRVSILAKSYRRRMGDRMYEGGRSAGREAGPRERLTSGERERKRYPSREEPERTSWELVGPEDGPPAVRSGRGDRPRRYSGSGGQAGSGGRAERGRSLERTYDPWDEGNDGRRRRRR